MGRVKGMWVRDAVLGVMDGMWWPHERRAR